MKPKRPVMSRMGNSFEDNRDVVEGTCKWFVRFTSIGGLSQLYATDLTISKVVWLMILLVGAGLTMFNVYNVILEFSSFGIATTVTLDTVAMLNFSAVTMCNHNRIHCGNLRVLIEQCMGNSTCDTGVKATDRLEIFCDLYIYGGCEASINMSETFKYGQVKSLPVCTSFYKKTNTPDLIRMKFTGYYSRLTYEEAEFLAHQPSDMIKSCLFQSVHNDSECNNLKSGVTKFFNPLYGFCYSFNYLGKSSRTGRTMPFNGPFYGLTLEVDLETNYYLREGQTHKAGLALFLHEPDKIPVFSSAAIDIFPNSASNLMIHQYRLARAKEPYVTNCSHTWARTSLGQHIKDHEYKYQSKICQSVCMHDIIFKACNCSLAQMTDIRHGHGQHSGLCKTLGSDKACIENRVSSLDKETITDACVCPLECEEMKYDTKISTSKWPSIQFWPELAARDSVMYNNEALTLDTVVDVLKASQTNETQEEVLEHMRDYIMENYLRLQIYFDSNSIEVIKEIPQYTGFSFLANLGGAFSLYLGISFAVLFELFEVVLRVCLGVFGKKEDK